MKLRGQGRIFDRPRGSERNWALAYYWRGQEQRESVARMFGKPAALVTRADAKRCLRVRLKEIARGTFVGPEQERLKIGELLDAYLEHLKLEGRKSLPGLTSHIKPAREAFGHIRAVDLTTAQVEAWMNRALAEDYARGTVHVWVGLLGAALRLARKRGQLAQVPHVPTIRVQNARKGFFEPDQVEKILAVLPEPVDDVVRFAYLTGWRRGEILPLTWAQVERARKPAGVIRLTDSKNDEGRVLPLVGELGELIERRWAARVVGNYVCPWVFHRKGKPVRTFRNTWRQAVKAAGLEGAVLHDFRRTAARDLVEKAGMDYATAMSVTGHKTLSMFRRYQIVDVRRTAEALAAVQRSRKADTGTDTNVVALRNS